MATLFRRMSELGLPSTPYPLLSELELAVRPAVMAAAHGRDLPPPAVLDPFDDDWSVPVYARQLDPRLRRAITAAARGWVVERYESG